VAIIAMTTITITNSKQLKQELADLLEQYA
jgi:hypothetical protein